MGFRYLLFRTWYEFAKKTGLLRYHFRTGQQSSRHLSLANWKKDYRERFFFTSATALHFKTEATQALAQTIADLETGRYEFFNSGVVYEVYSWLLHPETGYTYPLEHWTKVPLYSAENGDIKFVWEKSKFSYVFNFIRADHVQGTDHSERVFADMLSWIAVNPMNMGPHYVCSQEIAIRVLNWIFALHYYSDSKHLTQEVFDLLTSSIYHQVDHVWQNINFSRVAVKNNHAVTETLVLYLYGLFFPFLPQARKWYDEGKRMFVQEVLDQVFDDGSDSQYSLNYLRVKLQLFTWAIFAARKNGDMLPEAFHQKVRKAAQFLSLVTLSNGKAPLYGANDGSLYFKLNGSTFDDYRPQLLPLLRYYNMPVPFAVDTMISEDYWWFSGTSQPLATPAIGGYPQLISYPDSGYYGVRLSADSLLLVRLGNHRFRPSHADNGHVDLWVDGVNLLRDSGTYKYLTEHHLNRYFTGAEGHNVMAVDNEDQMERGFNFIWYNWTGVSNVQQELDEHNYRLEGTIRLKGPKGWYNIRRTIAWCPYNRTLEVQDRIDNRSVKKIVQYWHPHPIEYNNIRFEAIDGSGCPLNPVTKQGYYSSKYGVFEEVPYVKVSATKSQIIKTNIYY